MDDERQRDDSDDRPPSAEGVSIDLIGTGGSDDRDVSHVLRALRDPSARLADLLAEAGLRGEARVRLVRDDEMAREHLAHKDIPGTTDVLTFDLADDDSGPASLDADILICIDEAHRQSRARGHDVARELMLYIVHGILHCTGYDDATEPQAERMHRREDELLDAIGLGPVYARRAASNAGEGVRP